MNGIVEFTNLIEFDKEIANHERSLLNWRKRRWTDWTEHFQARAVCRLQFFQRDRYFKSCPVLASHFSTFQICAALAKDFMANCLNCELLSLARSMSATSGLIGNEKINIFFSLKTMKRAFWNLYMLPVWGFPSPRNLLFQITRLSSMQNIIFTSQSE